MAKNQINNVMQGNYIKRNLLENYCDNKEDLADHSVCSCKECDSTECFAIRSAFSSNARTCKECKQFKNNINRAKENALKNKTILISESSKNINSSKEMITKHTGNDSSWHKLVKSDVCHDSETYEVKLKNHTGSYFSDIRKKCSSIHIPTAEPPVVNNTTAELSAQIILDGLNDYPTARSLLTKPATETKPDIFTRLRNVYKECSCKICECISVKPFLSSRDNNTKICSCKSCYCDDCKISFASNDLLHKKLGEPEFNPVYSNRKNNRYHFNSSACTCSPCQCIQCKLSGIQISTTHTVAQAEYSVQHNTCDCSPCECSNCTHNYNNTSNLHGRSIATATQEFCPCEICTNNMCSSGTNCLCETQNSVMRKPIKRDHDEYDIRRLYINNLSSPHRNAARKYDVFYMQDEGNTKAKICAHKSDSKNILREKSDSASPLHCDSQDYPSVRINSKKLPPDCELLNCRFQNDDYHAPIFGNSLIYCNSNIEISNQCNCIECECITCQARLGKGNFDRKMISYCKSNIPTKISNSCDYKPCECYIYRKHCNGSEKCVCNVCDCMNSKDIDTSNRIYLNNVTRYASFITHKKENVTSKSCESVDCSKMKKSPKLVNTFETFENEAQFENIKSDFKEQSLSILGESQYITIMEPSAIKQTKEISYTPVSPVFSRNFFDCNRVAVEHDIDSDLYISARSSIVYCSRDKIIDTPISDSERLRKVSSLLNEISLYSDLHTIEKRGSVSNEMSYEKDAPKNYLKITEQDVTLPMLDDCNNLIINTNGKSVNDSNNPSSTQIEKQSNNLETKSNIGNKNTNCLMNVFCTQEYNLNYKKIENTLREAQSFSNRLNVILDTYENANKNFVSVSQSLKNSYEAITLGVNATHYRKSVENWDDDWRPRSEFKKITKYDKNNKNSLNNANRRQKLVNSEYTK
ncbi:uncharacterized protein LOC126974326, partial [Leptidea sinapis]|uniref:uncharacterized protein LOC126974326 n=1 Tax=Leptidea sinapis TaxID=189913 RepID=UPI0021C3066E